MRQRASNGSAGQRVRADRAGAPALCCTTTMVGASRVHPFCLARRTGAPGRFAAEQVDRQGADTGLEVVVLDVPLLVDPAGHPGHVEPCREDDDAVRRVQRPHAEPLLVGGVEPRHHQQLVRPAARVERLGAGRPDRHAVTDETPQEVSAIWVELSSSRRGRSARCAARLVTAG